MFTGIVQVQGEVSKKTTTRHGESLEITVPKSFKRGLIRGASVSVNGVCLTVIKHEKEKITLALKGYGILEDQTDCFPKPPKGFLETEKKYIV